MSFVFRPNASPPEKVYTLTVYAWMGLAIYGMTTSFVSERWLDSLAAYLSILLALAFCIPLFRDRQVSEEVASFGIVKRCLFYFLWPVFAYGLAWVGLSYGTPALIIHFFGQERMGPVTVVSKSSGNWDRYGCDHYVRVREQISSWEAKMCVEQDLWRRVQRGGTLNARFKISPVGKKIEELWQP